MKNFIFILILSFSSMAQAGLSETGLSANFKLSQVDKNNSQDTISLTASYAYYFWELSALEISYTNGKSTLISQPTINDSKVTIKTFFELFGFDFVLGFGEKGGPFLPYVKFGVAYLSKEIFRSVSGLGGGALAAVDGFVPSAGLGIKYKLTKEWIFKVGVDAWTTPLDEDDITLDYSARLGISWLY